VTQLAHDCAVLRIPFDSVRLFYGDDPNYETWLMILRDKVNATNAAEASKAKARSRGKGK
jgi:hypothetical protein